MQKEFGKLSREQAREFFALLHQGRVEKAEVDELIKARQERFVAVLACVPAWSYLYEIPVLQLTRLYLLLLCPKSTLDAIKAAPDPNQAYMDWVQTNPVPGDFDSWPVEEFARFLALTMAVFYNVEAMGIFGRWLNDIVAEGRAGSDEAFFDAVLVDAGVASAPSMARRIGRNNGVGVN